MVNKMIIERLSCSDELSRTCLSSVVCFPTTFIDKVLLVVGLVTVGKSYYRS